MSWCILIDGAEGYHVTDHTVLGPFGPYPSEDAARAALLASGWADESTPPEGFGDREAGWNAEVVCMTLDLPRTR